MQQCTCVQHGECLLCLYVCICGAQVPHDRPEVSQRMIETFIESAEQGLDTFEPLAGTSSPQLQHVSSAAIVNADKQEAITLSAE